MPLFNFTSEENGAIAISTLRALCRKYGAIPSDLDEDIRSVVMFDPIEAASALRQISDPGAGVPSRAMRNKIWNDPILRWHLMQAVDSFVFVVAMRADVGFRGVVKYEHEEGQLSKKTTKPMFKFSQAMGWFPFGVRLPVPGATCASSYHLEVVTPDGVTITGIEIMDRHGVRKSKGRRQPDTEGAIP
jgi:hypothetical protein